MSKNTKLKILKTNWRKQMLLGLAATGFIYAAPALTAVNEARAAPLTLDYQAASAQEPIKVAAYSRSSRYSRTSRPSRVSRYSRSSRSSRGSRGGYHSKPYRGPSGSYYSRNSRGSR